MKKLYLIRHAKSSWDDPFQADFDRPLNKRGRKDAPRMGKMLREMSLHPDMVISSPAERALTTCLIIAEKIGYPLTSVHTDKRLYHASEEQLLAVVHGLNDANDEIGIFGHNPGLTDFTNAVAVAPVTDNIPTAGVVGLSFTVDSWSDITWGTGRLMFFKVPKNI